ncbi:hypothetical protein QJS66_12030 [Kocuria rhizophila]|nr:hypothetical protein QJS66_12030 [Kocuria rhizophila]
MIRSTRCADGLAARCRRRADRQYHLNDPFFVQSRLHGVWRGVVDRRGGGRRRRDHRLVFEAISTAGLYAGLKKGGSARPSGALPRGNRRPYFVLAS